MELLEKYLKILDKYLKILKRSHLLGKSVLIINNKTKLEYTAF